MLSWLKSEGDSDPDEEGVLTDLTDAIESSVGYDGYDLARQLDRAGWDPDAALVDILDRTFSAVRSVHEQVCADWMKTVDHTPMPIGAKVKFNGQNPREARGLIGEIASEMSRNGQYTVRFAELGHVERGKQGPIGYVLNFEDLEATP